MEQSSNVPENVARNRYGFVLNVSEPNHLGISSRELFVQQRGEALYIAAWASKLRRTRLRGTTDDARQCACFAIHEQAFNEFTSELP